MQLLTILTLIYAAILVVALAASLIAILVYLRRVADALGEVRDILGRVQEATGHPQGTPLLESSLKQLQDASGEWAEAVSEARKSLVAADEHLARLAEGDKVTVKRKA